MRQILAVSVALFVAVAGSALGMAQEPAKKTIWDGALYTQEQAARGASTFAATCSNCHGANLQGNNAKALVGDQFFRDFQQRTVEYLLTFISKNMPNNAPGTLDATTYLDLTAFILSRNDVPAGTAPFTATSGVGIEILPKGGALKELADKTLARVVGCLTKGGSGWIVANATAPERADNSGAVASDATRTLGERSYQLLFVLTRLDRMAGHRVFVKGLLVGEGGADGINVTEVGSVATTCP
jgi:mono/diheme cytochrome c family protein